MPITRTPILDDDGTGTTGTIFNNTWKQEFYNQIDAFVDPPSAFVNLPGIVWTTNTGATITVTTLLNRYQRLRNDLVFWEGAIDPFSLPSAGAAIYANGTPFSISSASARYPVVSSSSGSPKEAYLVQGSPGAPRFIRSSDLQLWPAGSGFLYWATLLGVTFP